MLANEPFGARLAAAMDQYGPLCVGIDPHRRILLEWGLNDDADGLRDFTNRMLAAVGGRVAAIKPQVAFFERHGAAGIKVLEDLIGEAREIGTLCIVDAKRGDVGSTMSAYADAYLRNGSPLAGDALTVTPYLGFDSLEPAIERAKQTGRGLFFVCLTSNPEGFEVQHALSTRNRPRVDTSVANLIALQTAAENLDVQPLGNFGLVIGATVGDAVERLGMDLLAVNGPLLAPGFGAQGAGPKELINVFGSARANVLVSASRSIAQAGPFALALRNATRYNVDAAAKALRG